MSVLQEPDHEQNTYVIDANSAAEMARLMLQDQNMTAGMGGIFPEQIDLSGVQYVLDLACGPGGWPLELAYAYSDIEVVGVDISERMIAYANAQAQVQQRTNISFRVMDILKPLDFPEHSFDLVNARQISGFMQRERWSMLLRECLRVLRPGGIMRLTEGEGGMSNQPHFEKALHIGVQALNHVGMCFSPNGLHYGIVQMLPYFFRQAGLSILGKRAHFIDFSFGTEAHESFYQNFTMLFPLLEPLVVKTGIATLEEWHNLAQKALAEMYKEDFCAAWIMVTVWGEKPL